MVTKSQDHSLAVFRRAEFEELASSRQVKTSRSNPEARAFLRNLAAGTDEQHADTRPHHVVGRSPALRQPLQGLRGDRSDPQFSKSGMRSRGRLPADPRRELLRGQRWSPRRHYLRRVPVHRGLCPNRPWRTSPTPGSYLRTGTFFFFFFFFKKKKKNYFARTRYGRNREVSRWLTVQPLSAMCPYFYNVAWSCSPRADPLPLRRIERGPRRRHDRRGRARRAVPDRVSGTAADRTRPRPQRTGHRPDWLAPFADRITLVHKPV